MTELISAESIVEEFEELDLSPRLGFASDPGENSPTMVNWRKDMICEVRDIQRNAERHHLERAAKAVCKRCDKGEPVSYKPGLGFWLHGTQSLTPCDGDAIWKLIPNDPAPAGPKE